MKMFYCRLTKELKKQLHLMHVDFINDNSNLIGNLVHYIDYYNAFVYVTECNVIVSLYSLTDSIELHPTSILNLIASMNDKSDINKLFVLENNTVHMCDCMSRIDMWGDFEDGEIPPRPLSYKEIEDRIACFL